MGKKIGGEKIKIAFKMLNNGKKNPKITSWMYILLKIYLNCYNYLFSNSHFQSNPSKYVDL